MRARLMALVSFCAVLLVAVLATPAVLTVRDSTVRFVDDELKDVVQALGVYLLSAPPRPEAAQFAATLAAGTPVTFYVVDDRGEGFGEPVPLLPATLTTPPAGLSRSDPSDLVPAVTVVDGYRVAKVAFHDGQRSGVVLASHPESDISSTVWERVGLLALATTAALAVALLAAWLLAGRLTRTVRKAVGTAEQLGDGVRDLDVPTSGPPELIALGQAHRRLADQIDTLLHRERQRSAEISHRLRTPLTALELAAERLLTRWPRTAASPEAGTLTGRLQDLEDELDQVILATRAAARDDPAPVIDLGAVIRSSLEFWLPMAAHQDRPTTIELPDRPVSVRMAPSEVTTAFDTLLGNVFRHTEQGVGFEVSVHTADGAAVLRIADHGAGRVIPAPAGRPVGSTGMGQVVAAGVAQRAGGALAIDTTAVGTVAVVTIPLASVRRPSPAPVTGTGDGAAAAQQSDVS